MIRYGESARSDILDSCRLAGVEFSDLQHAEGDIKAAAVALFATDEIGVDVHVAAVRCDDASGYWVKLSAWVPHEDVEAHRAGVLADHANREGADHE